MRSFSSQDFGFRGSAPPDGGMRDSWAAVPQLFRALQALPAPWEERFGPLKAGATDDLVVVGQFGQSLDGRVATESGHSHYINGPAGLATTSEDSAVSWLPLYHDMGLVGMALGPLYSARPAVLMTPQAFIKRPAGWLKAMSRYRATVSFAPNFAYDLAVRRVRDSDLEGLDLSVPAPGEYELICLPLRIEGCDGAPARAVLVQ